MTSIDQFAVLQLENSYLQAEIARLSQKIKEQDRLKEEFVRSSFDGFWDWHVNDGYEYLSPRFWEMFGESPEDKEHCSTEWKKIILPEDLEKARTAYKLHIESKGKIPYELELRYWHVEGHLVTVLCKGRVIRWDDHGRPIRMVGIVTDITHLKKIQSELERSNKELEEFASIMAHDLKGPLKTISGFNSLLKREYSDKLDDRGQKYVDYSVAACYRMDRLINSVFNYAQVNKNRLSVDKVRLNSLLNDLVVDLGSLLKESNGSILIEEDLGFIPGDRHMIRQLFQNLISNGLKFNRSSEKTVRIFLDGFTQTTKTIVVEDNGIGIPQDKADEAFEMFKGLHNSNEFEGTGLGLSICKKIMDLHGGVVRIGKNEKPGTQVYLSFKI